MKRAVLDDWELLNAPIDMHVHTFRGKTLYRPTWCSECKKFITGVKAVACGECKAVFHEACVGPPQQPSLVKPTFCREEQSIYKSFTVRAYLPPGHPTALTEAETLWFGKLSEKYGAHVHRVKEMALFRPTWCSECKKFIIGMRALKCVECREIFHEKCLGDRFIEIEVSLPVTSPTPSSPPKIEHTAPHEHRFRNRILYRPTWCSECKKFITGVKAVACGECKAVFHQGCVNASAARETRPRSVKQTRVEWMTVVSWEVLRPDDDNIEEGRVHAAKPDGEGEMLALDHGEGYAMMWGEASHEAEAQRQVTSEKALLSSELMRLRHDLKALLDDNSDDSSDLEFAAWEQVKDEEELVIVTAKILTWDCPPPPYLTPYETFKVHFF